MDGKFIFPDHACFREIMDVLNDDIVQEMHLDVKGVEYIDSAGMGLFLLLGEKAANKAIRLTMHNPVGQLKDMLGISQLEKLFKVSYDT